MSEGTIQSGAKQDPAIAGIVTGMPKTSEANTPDEEQVVKSVAQLFLKSRSWKNQWAKDHERWWNLWENNHYRGRMARTLTQAVVGQVWSAIETFVGHIADVIPDPLARARHPKHKAKAKTVEKWLIYEAEHNDIEQEVQHPVRSAAVTGIGWLGVEWDETKLSGLGDVSINALDNAHMFPAPYCRNLKEALYLIEGKNIPRDYVVRSYERGREVPPGPVDPSLLITRGYWENKSSATPAASTYQQFNTTDGTQSWWSPSSGQSGARKSDLVTLLRCWVRTHDDKMRLIEIANGVVLRDGPSPYDDEDFPYVVFNILPTLDTIQGRGLVQFIEGLQDILNQSLSLLIDQQRFSSDPMLGVSSANLEDAQLIDNTPGAVLPDVTLASQGRPGYYWLQAPGFNQAWLQVQEMITDYFDSVLGRVDIMKGERPIGVDTMGGMEIVRDQANIRLKSLARWVNASLKRMFLLTLSRLRQFAKDERILRIAGKLGQEEYVTVNPVTDAGVDGNVEQDMTIPEDAEFEIEFAKAPPGGQQAVKEDAILLAQTPGEDGMPMVDRQYVLEKFGVEEAPEIIERMEQKGQMMAEAQAQAQGAQAGAPPPGQEGDPLEEVMSILGGV